MSSRLSAREKCYNHALREAVARCPSCGRFLCRECVTEHDGQILCALCLGQPRTVLARESLPWLWFRRASLCLLGLLAAWVFFYLLGEVLLAIPAEVHEGTIWQSVWEEEP